MIELKPSGAEVRIQYLELGQYYGCWRPGSLHRQVINSHDIDVSGKCVSVFHEVQLALSVHELRGDKKKANLCFLK